MSKKFSGSEYPLSKIFSSDFDYVIPSYQRPYAWTVDQVRELIDDLLNFYKDEKEDTYFLGSIVLIKEEGKPYSEVIDGQQWLTSFSILLAAITAKLGGNLEAILKATSGSLVEQRKGLDLNQDSLYVKEIGSS